MGQKKKIKVDSPEHACARLQLHPCLTDAGAQVQIRWCKASLEKNKSMSDSPQMVS